MTPALRPPVVMTGRAVWNAAAGTATFEGSLKDLGDQPGLDAGFEYRVITGLDVNERQGAWTSTEFTRRAAAGDWSVQSTRLQPNATSEYHAVVRHPWLTLYGASRTFTAR